MFVVFEGIEASGKSTQAKLLYERLIREGWGAILTHEPGDTPVGKKLREIVLSEPMDRLTELLLFLADRREHVMRVIAPALHEGKVVLCDRYLYSTVAYQMYGRGLRKEFVDELHTEIVGNIFPRRVYLLDIDVEEAFRRKKGTLDRIEQESLAFHQRVREGFLDMARRDPVFCVLDGKEQVETLHEKIWGDFHRFLKEEK
ncbi:dTMP kinase [Thermospira aquatica]|uniref:Thymidylate kinase n=1 Tax=Thermospira aquatica TaxID=2828656 RepID=A0AAX3BCV9_9SPIR|nr:dTMP kinase [Thermospira aquatica]URA10138.1 dTMP kinase [Thermospira aquatica]